MIQNEVNICWLKKRSTYPERQQEDEYLCIPGGATIVTQIRANSAQQEINKKEKVYMC